MSDRCHPHQTRSCPSCTPAPVPDLAAIRALADEWVGTKGGPTSTRVAQDHEPRWASGACKCGTRLGDNIDWTWHLINSAVSEAGTRLRALLDTIPAPTEPTGERDATASAIEAAAAGMTFEHYDDEERHLGGCILLTDLPQIVRKAAALSPTSHDGQPAERTERCATACNCCEIPTPRDRTEVES